MKKIVILSSILMSLSSLTFGSVQRVIKCTDAEENVITIIQSRGGEPTTYVNKEDEYARTEEDNDLLDENTRAFFLFFNNNISSVPAATLMISNEKVGSTRLNKAVHTSPTPGAPKTVEYSCEMPR